MSAPPSLPRPTPAQIAAADPAQSAWVGANAGSGKTRVLAQRVARLLLAGARPEEILCLTYTKAAAVEMQTRLFTMLGGWTMAEDRDLGAELAALEGSSDPVTAPERLAAARRLFAAALETPGGLKIQTIHAFCAALLSRFPLEAGVAPGARVLGDRDGARLLDETRRGLATEDGAVFAEIAGRIAEAELGSLTAGVLGARDAFSRPLDAGRLAQVFGEAASETRETALRSALDAVPWEALSALAAAMATGSSTMLKGSAELQAAVAQAARAPEAAAEAISRVFLTLDGEPRRSPLTKPVLANHPPAAALAERMTDWALALDERLAAIETAGRSAALHRYAHAFLARYRAAKSAAGALDYADLVASAAGLLDAADTRAWVLYKLDRGIAHLLVDEAQDTSPEQWRVVSAIAGEFFADPGRGRTLFVVGDEKQSIYSFQGAEPRAFAEMSERVERAIADGSGGDRALARPALDISFRSAPGILRLVDAVFEGQSGALSPSGRGVVHRASREGDASLVELWPVIAAAQTPSGKPDWWEPQAADAPQRAATALADTLADEIARMIGRERRPRRGGAPGAPIRAGDILVLLRRRGALASPLIRALKDRGVPVAGADRLALSDSLAVRDLLALAAAAITPADDLSLAAVLRSPLAGEHGEGISETALFTLAHGRRGTLRAALAAAACRHPREAAMIADLADAAERLRPYELLERILIEHDGRRRLVARLGPEAEDLIDALLDQALAYEAAEVPSVTGFLAWMARADQTVKREMEAAGDAVRVMTVHGAKGLEAPVVVLPDTLGGTGGREPPVLEDPESGLALWIPPKGKRGRAAERARTARAEREADEALRLLYVALTRAEDRLIVCGAGTKRSACDWYALVEAGMRRLGAKAIDAPTGQPGEGLRLGAPPEPVSRAEASEAPAVPAAVSLGAAPVEPASRRLAPSSLLATGMPPTPLEPAPPDRAPRCEGAGPTPPRGDAKAFGTAVHLLLERLPGASGAARIDLARELLAAALPDLPPEARDAAVAEASAVLARPDLAWIFGSDSLPEASVALDLPELSPRRLIGRIDRLVIGTERVAVIDIKTDRHPPASPGAIPRAYLAQIAAYRTALARLWPSRRVEAALLYTAGPVLLEPDAAALDHALADAAREAASPAGTSP